MRCGEGVVIMKKKYLSEAFRNIPVSSFDWWLLGSWWQSSYWIDKCLLFGLKTSPMMWDLFAKKLHCVMLQLSWLEIFHNLVNFWSIYLTFKAAENHTNKFDKLCNNFGLSMQAKKVNLCKSVNFFRIKFDIIAIVARFSPKN